jgi:hypothetical protein
MNEISQRPEPMATIKKLVREPQVNNSWIVGLSRSAKNVSFPEAMNDRLSQITS